AVKRGRVAEVSYTIIVADNFHYQDRDEEYVAGTYASAEEALAEARCIVDRSVLANFRSGLTAEAVYERYTLFGEDPYIVVSDGAPEVSFSAWDYARARVGEIVAAASNENAAEE